MFALPVSRAVLPAKGRHWILAALFFCRHLTAPAQVPSTLDYQLNLDARSDHLLQVELTIAVTGSGTDFGLPAWAPGSYQILNYAKFVQDFSARDERDRALDWVKLDKQTWRVFHPASTRRLSISYRVFANLLSDTYSELSEAHAHVFGPQVFMYPVGRTQQPVRLRVTGLRGWRIATGMAAQDDSTFAAASYDELVDCPLEIGDFREVHFDTLGARFVLAVHDDSSTARLAAFAAQLQRVVTEQIVMMGGAPFEKYVFLWHVDPRAKYYGLEHGNSTCIGMPHRLGDLSSAGSGWGVYGGFARQDIDLEYAAHEFFHLWNVKRLRPAGLGPFDYTREVYTTSLWFSEGFTDYYGYLTLLRSGLWSPRKWLRMYAGLMSRYHQSSGWRFRSPAASSFDTWLWSYGNGEQGNLARTFFSYYPSGNLIALCMDLRLRHATQNRKNLDQVMVALHRRFSPPRPGFTAAEWWQAVSDLTGLAWQDFRRRYVEGTEELPLAEMLALAGVRVDTLSAVGAGYLGLSVEERNNQVVIAEVAYNSNAAQAGFDPGDRLIAIEGEAVTLDNWQDLLHRHAPGTRVTVLIARHGSVREVIAELGRQPAAEFELTVDPAAPAAATMLREAWWRSVAWPE